MLDETEFNELINGEKPTLVDFYAEWCGPCLAMMPAYEALMEELKDEVNVIKMDVDKHLDVALKYKVMGVPTFILFQKGMVKWKEAGILSNEQLKKRLVSDV